MEETTQTAQTAWQVRFYELKSTGPSVSHDYVIITEKDEHIHSSIKALQEGTGWTLHSVWRENAQVFFYK